MNKKTIAQVSLLFITVFSALFLLFDASRWVHDRIAAIILSLILAGIIALVFKKVMDIVNE